MLTFSNEGHRKEFQQLGILDEGQIQISAPELFQRTVETQKIEEVLYLFRQELATYGSKLTLIDGTLRLARKQAEAIVDQATLDKARGSVQSVLLTLQQSTEQTEVIAQVTTAIRDVLSQPEFAAHLTSIVEEHIQVIGQLVTALPEQVEQKRESVIEHLQTITAVIEEKRRELGVD